MRATSLVLRDDLFVVNDIDAPFALKGGVVKNLQIELPIVMAAILNRASIKVALSVDPHPTPTSHSSSSTHLAFTLFCD
jgi:hypothetical protein